MPPDRLLALLALGVLLAGFGPADWWLCDLLANLRLHVCAAFAILLPVLLIRRRWTTAGACLGLGALAVLTITDDTGHLAQPEDAIGALRIASYNAGHGAAIEEDFVDYVAELSPDILIIQELRLSGLPSGLENQFPYRIALPRRDAFGIAVLSRLPFTDGRILSFPGSGIPYVRASLTMDTFDVDVYGIHLQWPMTPAAFSERNAQLEALKTLVDGNKRPWIACGDWNLTPWSKHYRRFLDGNAYHARAADRLKATWPASLGPFGIAIDHCVATEPFAVSGKSVGPTFASDHRPMTAHISTPRKTD